jgi:group I intron endonuclease
MIGTEIPPQESGIYRITIGDNFYYGSAVNLQQRRRCHLRELKKGIHRNRRMQHSFNKYGTFEFQVVDTVPDKSQLIDTEQKHISKHFANSKCMNISPTAGNCLGVKHSEQAKANMSKSKIGLMVGMFHPLFGKPRPEETKIKLSLAIKGSRYSDDRLKRHRKSCRKKSRSLAISISKTGSKQSAETVEKRVSKFRGSDNWRSRPVWIKIESEEKTFFDTITDAASFLGVSSGSLLRWLEGKRAWPDGDPSRPGRKATKYNLTGGYAL